MSGWQTLARHYRALSKPSGSQVFVGIATLNSVEYKGVLLASVSAEGLYLSALTLFAVGHAPLLLPWTAFQELPTEKILWAVRHRFEIRAGADTIEVAVQNAALADVTNQWIRYVAASSAPDV